jgi:hypothetical protein
MIEKLTFLDYPNCLRLSNGTVDLIVSTDFGPRILFYGLTGGENILGLHPDARVETAIGEWRPYGGHRLWMAPENMPLSYAPDNAPVEVFEENELSTRFLSPIEEAARIQKEISVTLDETGSDAVVEHRITNQGDREIELSAWALTIMRAGGAAVVPNETFKPYGPETLLPVRSFAVWSYTDFTDPRWQFEKDFIRLRVDESLPDPQKFGVTNSRGWAAYEWENLLFVKRFDFIENADFPDLNSNTEIYTAGGFAEVETLSPLVKLAPHESIVHTETWQLFENAKIENVLEGTV